MQCLNCPEKTGGVIPPFRRLFHDRGGSTPPTPRVIRPPRGVENHDDWGGSKMNWGGLTPPAIQALAKIDLCPDRYVYVPYSIIALDTNHRLREIS